MPELTEGIEQNYNEFMETHEAHCGAPSLKSIIDTFSFKPERQDVEEFVQNLADYNDIEKVQSNAAIYLSALMRHSDSRDFLLDFRKLNMQGIALNSVGWELAYKNIIVQGNVGHAFLGRAGGCSATLYGNAGDSAGYCAGRCKVDVYGNVGNFPAVNADDSLFMIFGSTGTNACEGARRTKVYVFGRLGPLREANESIVGIGPGTEIYKTGWIIAHPGKAQRQNL